MMRSCVGEHVSIGRGLILLLQSVAEAPEQKRESVETVCGETQMAPRYRDHGFGGRVMGRMVRRRSGIRALSNLLRDNFK